MPTSPKDFSAAGMWGSTAVSPLVCIVSIVVGASLAMGTWASVVSLGWAGIGSAASLVDFPP